MILIDKLIKDPNLIWKQTTQEIDGRWYVAKPLNYEKPYMKLRTRIKDAWAVFQCKAIAVEFYKDRAST